jgi:hypothetical protein
MVGRSQLEAIRATVRSGRLELDTPSDWPEGTEVLIEPMNSRCEKIGIDESEWSDDPMSLADWEAWIQTIEPLEFTPEESEMIAEFESRMRQYNVEAVRRQMQQTSL